MSRYKLEAVVMPAGWDADLPPFIPPPLVTLKRCPTCGEARELTNDEILAEMAVNIRKIPNGKTAR